MFPTQVPAYGLLSFLRRVVYLAALLPGWHFARAQTFSDVNWISLGGVNGAESDIYAAVADGSGNLYIGGSFRLVGNVAVNHIAKWDGNSWSGLGSGMGGFGTPYVYPESGVNFGPFC